MSSGVDDDDDDDDDDEPGQPCTLVALSYTPPQDGAINVSKEQVNIN